MRTEAGFTLVEMLMTLAVGGLLMAMSVVGIGGAMRQYNMNNATQEIASIVREARFTAVAKNRTMRVRFNCPSPGAFRMIEVVGNAAIDDAGDRCSETAYPYPDPNPAALPNADGPVHWLTTNTTFGAIQNLQISTMGRVTPLTNCPACITAAPPASIGLINGYETQTITVSAAGRIDMP